ncbi:melanocortin receptor 5-like [Clytia hemisphaerica]|uniref:G-protein coupled receptors family 1 profile domain-containing protein n=1 Tax=Clytia hemisphaerica TaxID=252671 RepID=A0A7M5XEV6_9CNID
MEESSAEYKILASAGIMVLILLSLFGNILVCCAVYHSRNLRARVNILIVSLAVSDILIATISMPLWMNLILTNYRNMSHQATIRMLEFSMFVDILGGIASIGNLVAISYERLWSVFSPLNHRRYLTNFTLGIIVACVWAYAIFVAATTVAWFHTWYYVTLYNAIVGFFFPLFLIIVAYLCIFIIVNKSPRTVVSTEDSFKINLTICIIVGLFVVCWAPHFIFSVLHQHCEVCYNHLLDNLWYRSLSTWLHYANSCVNPLVYGIANAQYQEAFKHVLKRLCQCCFFKKDTLQDTERLPSLYFPNGHQERCNMNDKLRVELEPDEKEQVTGAVGYDEDHSYPPGDYRALPIFPAGHRNRRWTSDTSTTTETFLSTSLMETPIMEDEHAQTALIIPTVYIHH